MVNASETCLPYLRLRPLILMLLTKFQNFGKQETEVKTEEVKPPVHNEYTNLYWQPDSCSVSENYYEIVEDNSSKQAGAMSGSGGILKSMRESLLRELRKDLTKLTR